MAIKSNDKIYFDSDCLSSFLATKSEDILLNLYGNKIVVSSVVYDEMRKVPFLKNALDLYISRKVFQEETFAANSDTFQIFRLLQKGDASHPKIGNGEASVIALAKSKNSTMASNNLKDISYYINYYNLNNLTTADIMFEAYTQKIKTLEELGAVWEKMIKRGQYLPTDTFSQWLKKNKNIL